MRIFKKKVPKPFTRARQPGMDVTGKWFRFGVLLLVLFVAWQSYSARKHIEAVVPQAVDQSPLIILGEDRPEIERHARLKPSSRCFSLPPHMQNSTRYNLSTGNGTELPCNGVLTLTWKIQTDTGNTLQQQKTPAIFALNKDTPAFFRFVLDGMEAGSTRFGVAEASHFAAFGLKEAPKNASRLYLFIEISDE